MRQSIASFLVLMFVASACGDDVTAPTNGDVVHNVVISVSIPGQCIVGGCDPPGSDRNTLAVVTVVNNGTSSAYLHACGTTAAYSEQQLVDGKWQAVGPAITCPITPGPIVLAAGESLRSNWFFAKGTRRIVVGISATATESDEALGSSASFVVVH